MVSVTAAACVVLMLAPASVAVAQTQLPAEAPGRVPIPLAPRPPRAVVDTVRVQLPVDAAMQDAAEYSRLFGVPFDEAMRRVRAQADSVPATDALRITFGARWAGISVEHRPVYRIIVLLTGTDPVPDQTIVAGGMTVPIVFRTGAAATRDTMLARIATYQAQIRAALPHPPGIGLDQRTGEMVVAIAAGDADLDRDDALRRRLAAMTGVPVRIDILRQRTSDMAGQVQGPGQEQGLGQGPGPVPVHIAGQPEPGTRPSPGATVGEQIGDEPIIGGARVVGTVDGKRYACTTGFAVSDGVRTGVVTAAHCPDDLTYVRRDGPSPPLDFVGQWGWGYQDVQVNVRPAASPYSVAPLFYADTAKTVARPVTTWRYRASTRAGDLVCHRGERTGYSCGQVAMIDFAPAGDLCGGACLATWVAVEGPSCRSGDSGAPVFEGTTALGLVKGGTYAGDGTCLYYYYMSTDYLPQGWTLLHR